ncbi:MAG: DUF4148 domain-containing protein [Burkholderiaceae bacterium]|nr:DUF4148 domain-containing protein [Burkholderiaceae bacterium]
MSIRYRTLLPFVAAALAMPAAVQASAEWHPTLRGAGYTYHYDHFQSAKTRVQVMAEVDAARKDGTLASMIGHNVPLPSASTGPVKSRQQVVDEMRNESPQDRRARMEMLING